MRGRLRPRQRGCERPGLTNSLGNTSETPRLSKPAETATVFLYLALVYLFRVADSIFVDEFAWKGWGACLDQLIITVLPPPPEVSLRRSVCTVTLTYARNIIQISDLLVRVLLVYLLQKSPLAHGI